ncbi:MAG: cytochrome c biogenesis protein CcdA, partial [Candidatus Babeliales bacterium]
AYNHYEAQLGKDMRIMDGTIQLTIPVKNQGSANPKAHLYISYLTRHEKTPKEYTIPLTFSKPVSRQQEKPRIQIFSKTPDMSSWATHIESLLSQSQSTWIQLLLSFLLGLLMSLTPCIYPMIPITVGILQAQGKKSIGYNFMLAFSYTCGISTTFALCGLMAALTGTVCGKLLVNPFFVLMMIALLLYFAFSMFGFYDMYTPRFLQKQADIKKGSFFSTFLFGMVSGSVASPCLTPGLALLLTIVGTLGSSILGFMLLFSFGIGLSIPLLLVGTFSSSLSMLPRAGMWMIEVKKFFGFMLIGMSFYFLNNILPWWIMLWLMGAAIVLAGTYYLYDAQKTTSWFSKAIKNITGMVAIAGSIIIFANAYQETFHTAKAPTCTYGAWETDYHNALACAKAANKKIFIDFWATFCSICKAIDKKVLASQPVQELLKNYVALKVDGSDPASEPFATLHKKYAIKGFPTFLLIDPHTGTIIKQWGSEIYQAPDTFMQELKKLL